MDKPTLKKKLKIKTVRNKKSIGQKLVSEKKEKEIAKIESQKQKQQQEIEKKKQLELQKTNENKIESSSSVESKKTEVIKKPEVRKTPRTLFIDPAEEQAKQKSFEAQSTKQKASSSHKKKSNYREDVLKNDSHKKFFMKQRESKNKNTQDSKHTSSIPKEIKITEYIQVAELARKLNVKSFEIISKLMRMGTMATITQSIDSDTAILIAEEYDCKAIVVSLYDETLIQEEKDSDEELEIRPPVVTVMGHVDHGKTKLLDALRSADVVAGEAGGITQHIGAYQITTDDGKKITFLDTPGHAAFTAMRARGADITDIVILIVAADDGVMPQTIEAIQHAKAAEVPIIVAINKIDLPAANVEKIEQELSQHNVVPEKWGGDIPFVEISALQKLNLDKLVDTILMTAELLDLKGNPNKRAVGTVIEAKLDQGRGPVATILINNGTLKIGDPYVVGTQGGRVRALVDDHGKKVKEAGPSTPIEILGLTGVPDAGDPMHVMESEKEAKKIVEKRQELNRQQEAKKITKVKLENLTEVIEDGMLNELKIIIKADVQGSVGAIQNSLEKLTTDEIRINIILTGTGEISESDVMLASAANAIIVAFNVRANNKVKKVADSEKVEIKTYNIIYQVIDDIKLALTGMLTPDVSQELAGEVEIQKVFKISNLGTVGGGKVRSGTIKRNNAIKLIRDGRVIFEGHLKTLKRFQEDVAEVKEGFECGVLIDKYNDLKEGDIVESYEEKETSRDINDILKEE